VGSAFAAIAEFIPALLAQIAVDRRGVFVGTARAQLLARKEPA
jgi:hypothetical protein